MQSLGVYDQNIRDLTMHMQQFENTLLWERFARRAGQIEIRSTMFRVMDL